MKTKKQQKELLKDTHEEITGREYRTVYNGIGECCYECSDGMLFFKPKEVKQKFPIVFKTDYVKCKVDRYMDLMLVCYNGSRMSFSVPSNKQALYDAVDFIREMEK